MTLWASESWGCSQLVAALFHSLECWFKDQDSSISWLFHPLGPCHQEQGQGLFTASRFQPVERGTMWKRRTSLPGPSPEEAGAHHIYSCIIAENLVSWLHQSARGTEKEPNYVSRKKGWVNVGGLLLSLPQPAPLAAKFLCGSFSRSSFLQARHMEYTHPFPRETTQRTIQLLYSAQIPWFLGDVQSSHSGPDEARWIRKLKLLFGKEKNEKQ